MLHHKNLHHITLVWRSQSRYIPHDGVYHPSKLGKICVLLNCSAEFQAKSINKELLSGPDLTNQFFGILTRFCKGKIAFMADVEAMYHQVQIPEDQQSFLKFLWCINQDIDSEPQDYVMCASQPAVQMLFKCKCSSSQLLCR